MFTFTLDDELQFYPSRYCSDRKIASIYGLALTHFDQDHVAGPTESCPVQHGSPQR